MMEVSSTRTHDLEQAQAAFRNTAEVLGILRSELVTNGFSEEGAESIAASMLIMAVDDE